MAYKQIYISELNGECQPREDSANFDAGIALKSGENVAAFTAGVVKLLGFCLDDHVVECALAEVNLGLRYIQYALNRQILQHKCGQSVWSDLRHR